MTTEPCWMSIDCYCVMIAFLGELI